MKKELFDHLGKERVVDAAGQRDMKMYEEMKNLEPRLRREDLEPRENPQSLDDSLRMMVEGKEVLEHYGEVDEEEGIPDPEEHLLMGNDLEEIEFYNTPNPNLGSETYVDDPFYEKEQLDHNKMVQNYGDVDDPANLERDMDKLVNKITKDEGYELHDYDAVGKVMFGSEETDVSNEQRIPTDEELEKHVQGVDLENMKEAMAAIRQEREEAKEFELNQERGFEQTEEELRDYVNYKAGEDDSMKR